MYNTHLFWCSSALQETTLSEWPENSVSFFPQPASWIQGSSRESQLLNLQTVTGAAELEWVSKTKVNTPAYVMSLD